MICTVMSKFWQVLPEQPLSLGEAEDAEGGAGQLLPTHHLPPHVHHHGLLSLSMQNGTDLMGDD